MALTIEGLRAATRDVHERLHGHPAFAPLMDTPVDAAGYAALLEQLAGFHAPAEAALFPAAALSLPELADLPQRRKAHLLAADRGALAAFFPPPAGANDGVRLPADLPRPVLLGCLYVTEGATLGGRELARRLEPALAGLGLRGQEGRRFFLAYDPLQGAMWRSFCATLEAVASGFTAGERATMESAARDLFLTLESWLTRSLRTPERALLSA